MVDPSHRGNLMTRFALVVLLIVAAAAPAQESADGFPLPPGAVRRFGSRQMRHPTGILTVAVSPDGKLVAVGCGPSRDQQAQDSQSYVLKMPTGEAAKK